MRGSPTPGQGIVQVGTADSAAPDAGGDALRVAASAPTATVRAITFEILSAFSMTVMMAIAKVLTPRIPLSEIVFCRAFFAFLPLLALAAVRRELASAFATRNVRGHLRRSVMGAGSMALSFIALRDLPLPEAVAIGYVLPLLIVALAALLLGERVGPRRWAPSSRGSPASS